MQTGPFAEIAELARSAILGRRPLAARADAVDARHRARLEALHVRVVQGTTRCLVPAFRCAAPQSRYNRWTVMAKTLELISTGTLVCLECVLMAVDAGLVRSGSWCWQPPGRARVGYGLDYPRQGLGQGVSPIEAAGLWSCWPSRACRCCRTLALIICAKLVQPDLASLARSNPPEQK